MGRSSKKQSKNFAKAKGKTAAKVTPTAVPFSYHPSWLTDKVQAWVFWLGALGVAAGLGYLTFWQIFEYDTFHLTKAGQLIVERRGFTWVDEWSHTIKGQPWYHFQWLASVIMAAAKAMGEGWSGLVWLRSLCTTILFSTLSYLIYQKMRAGIRPLVLAGMLLPWIYLMVWLRLQMRPDIFGIICFAGLLGVLHGVWTAKFKRSWGLGIIWLWANLHTGTVPLGIFVYGLYQFTSTHGFAEQLRQKILWSSAAALCWFATPLGHHILEVLFLNYQTPENPDLQPLTWKFFQFDNGGWSYMLWVPYTILGFIGIARDDRMREPWGRFFGLAGGMIFTGLVFHRMRTIPYQVIFMLPFVAAQLNAGSRLIWGLRPLWSLGGAAALLYFFWGVAMPVQVSQIAVPRGDSVSKTWNPVDAAEFLKKLKPQRELLNHYNFGGYLIGELPEYPVAIDGRELPFLKFEREMSHARQTPEDWGSFLTRHKINVVMEKTPEMQPLELKTVREAYKHLYPAERWSLVYADTLAMIFLRRIPEHNHQIAQYENKGGILGGVGGGGRSFRENELEQLKGQDPALYNSIQDVLEDVKRRSK